MDNDPRVDGRSRGPRTSSSIARAIGRIAGVVLTGALLACGPPAPLGSPALPGKPAPSGEPAPSVAVSAAPGPAPPPEVACPDPEQFCVAVAELAGDQAGEVRRSLLQSLTALAGEPAATARTGEQTSRGIHVLAAPSPACTIEPGDTEPAITRGHDRARACLDKTGASLLLWGQVEGATHAPVLFVTGTDDALRGERFPLGDRGLSFGDGLDGAHGLVAELIVASQYAAIESQDGRDVTALLSPRVAGLRAIASSERASTWTPKRRVELTLLVENGQMTVSRSPFDRPALDRAIAALRAAVTLAPRDKDPMTWALAQAELGNALYVRGERELGAALPEAAVRCYKAALEERTRERAPFEWAALQGRIGLAYFRAIRSTGLIDWLGDAASAFREALKVRTIESAPRAWASTQNALGDTMWEGGGLGLGIGWLAEAPAYHREALKVYTRGRYPVAWGRTQLHLGNALLAFARRSSQREEPSCQAFAAHLAAWSVLAPLGHPGAREASGEAASDLETSQHHLDRDDCTAVPAALWDAWEAERARLLHP